MSKFALQARWVVPIDAPPIAGGIVTIEGDKIIAVGTCAQDGTVVQDLGDVVLIPGLVNAHTHLEFSQLESPLGEPGMPLPAWIQLVIANRSQQTDSVAGCVAGLQESLRAGVTTLGEIATSSYLADQATVSELVAFQEVIGFSAGRVDSVFADLQQRLQSSRATHLGISPHAPYTVHPELLKKLVRLASEKRLPVAMHLAESPEELHLIRGNSGPFRELLEARSMWDDSIFSAGLTVLDYLKVLALAPRSLVVHGNYLTTEEIEFVAEQRKRMSMVYCPRTHAFFEHEAYPLAEMLKAGVHLAIGTDSRASNPDLNMLSELRFLAQKFESISPEEILRLGTLGGAEALGFAETVGSLAPGKYANLLAIKYEANAESPASFVLSGEAMPQQVWVRGCEIRV